MGQMHKTKGMIATAGLLTGLAVAGVPAFAHMAAPATPPVAGPATPGGGMMEHAMPSGQTAMHPEMMQKMAKMMDGCNHMMAAMAQEKGPAPGAGGAGYQGLIGLVRGGRSAPHQTAFKWEPKP
jgi:hypothetical protein